MKKSDPNGAETKGATPDFSDAPHVVEEFSAIRDAIDDRTYLALYKATLASILWGAAINRKLPFWRFRKAARAVLAERWFLDNGLLRADELAKINALRVEIYLMEMCKGLGLDEILSHLVCFFRSGDLMAIPSPVGSDRYLQQTPENGWVHLCLRNPHHPGFITFSMELEFGLSETTTRALSLGYATTDEKWPSVKKVEILGGTDYRIDAPSSAAYIAGLESIHSENPVFLGAKLFHELVTKHELG